MFTEFILLLMFTEFILLLMFTEFILLLMFTEFKPINQLLSSLKSSGNHRFFLDFRRKSSSLIRVKSCSFRSESWRQSPAEDMHTEMMLKLSISSFCEGTSVGMRMISD